LVVHISRGHLSTAARFRQFAGEFLAKFRSQGKRAARIHIAEKTIGGRRYFVFKRQI
jgi:hypothetical protein